jgi:hypothetical protein
MSHFAKVENGIVTDVIVADQDFINSGVVGDYSLWKQTSYNTRGNVHYGQDGQPDGGVALRANYATIGCIYDEANDVFYPPKIYNTWVMNESTWTWEAPVAKPDDGQVYIGTEATLSWDYFVPKTPIETVP